MNRFRDRLIEQIRVSRLSNEKVAASIAFALGSVFLPFPGFHTPFLILFCMFFRLSLPIVYTVNWINNPATLAPICGVSYFVGFQILSLFQPTEMKSLGEIGSQIASLRFDQLDPGVILDVYLPMVIGSLPFLVFIPLFSYAPLLKGVRRFRSPSKGPSL